MHGMLSVGVIALALIAAVIFLVRRAVDRWWDYGIVLAIAAILFKPLLNLVSGDVSRYLPGFLWSDGADGKDEIILASIASTIFLPLIVAALLIIAFKALRARLA